MSNPTSSRLLAYALLLSLWASCSPAQVAHPDAVKQLEKTVVTDTVAPALAADSITPHPLAPLPDGFADLREVIPTIAIDLRYYSQNNFIGDTVHGYLADRAILSNEAAEALRAVQLEINPSGLGLLLYDAYRPQQAVDHFRAWAREPADTLTKRMYYPNLHKRQVFKQGYVARRSSHSRGSAVDVTLIYLHSDSNNRPIDMGSPWDLFDSISHTKSPLVTEQQSANRELLRLRMVSHGFRSLPHEWWHFRLEEEPFPDTYFDFEVR